ncbi:unnamed protein product [Ceutorhynchus assimilis]|uniref:Uncharacterized protein n=1 Tax=Ceutorhynchus assimilis TaxID=467358 RepID=A0A9N9QLU6_9CUCU|nr:unnamed protein product [Ceutorhynchus assimilis]
MERVFKMAESEGDDLDPANENPKNNELNNDSSNGEVFKCCGKRATTIVCKVCSALFHFSCANRANKIRRLEANFCICLECEDHSTKNGQSSDAISYFKQQISYLTNEVTLKNRIIKELEEKNGILVENNIVLKENNGLLVEKIQRILYDEINKVKKTDLQNKKDLHNNENIPMPQKGLGNAVNQQPDTAEDNQLNKVSTTPTYSRVVKAAQGRQNLRISIPAKRSGNINPNNQQSAGSDISSSQKKQNKQSANTNKELSKSPIIIFSDNEDKQQDGFVFPRKMFKKKRLGKAQPTQEGNFVGGDRKVWLYLYRVKRECTETDIITYIKTQPGFTDLPVTVREIPSEQNKLKCFVVTAPLQKKDQMYDPEFWPQFVGVIFYPKTK